MATTDIHGEAMHQKLILESPLVYLTLLLVAYQTASIGIQPARACLLSVGVCVGLWSLSVC